MSEQTTEKAQPRCTCPRGLGYRFHRYPCARAGEIENVVSGEVALRVPPGATS